MVDFKIPPEFKVIPDFPDYAINRDGIVIRVKTSHQARSYAGRVIKPGIYKSTGYMYMALWDEEKQKKTKLHRLVMNVFIGKSKLQINHIDGNKQNNSLSNLEYCTAKENILHAQELGLITSWRLIDHQICNEIVELYATGISLTKIEKRYRITRYSIKKILEANNVKLNIVKKITPNQINKIKEYRSQGMTQVEIAKSLGISKSSVGNYLNE